MVDLLWWPARLLLGRASAALRRGVLMAVLVGCIAAAWLAPVSGPPLAAALTVFAYAWLFHTVEQTRATSTLRRAVAAVSGGDLSQRVEVDGAGALGDIAGQVERMSQTLSRMVANTRSEAQLVAMAGERMVHSARELAASTDEQAHSLEQTSAGVSALADSVRRNADDAGQADRLAGQVRQHAEEGIAAVGKAVDSVRRIEERSQRMSQIIAVIDGITFQTNILALNAAVEAARAGESGRGFAVVAQEVKALASQTAKATSEISAQITGMQTATQESVAAINAIGVTIGRISGIAATIAGAIGQQGAAAREIAQNIHETSRGTTEVATNIAEVNSGARETGQASARVLTSARLLSEESGHLKQEMSRFVSTVRAM
jgi:methyl-accepting chemotaxis protein